MGLLRVKATGGDVPETQPDVGCKTQALEHTHPQLDSLRQSAQTGLTLRPLCSVGAPWSSLLSHPQPCTHSSLPRKMGQRAGRGASTGDWHRDQQPNGAARREASEKGLPRQQAPAEPTRGLDSRLLFLEVGPGLVGPASRLVFLARCLRAQTLAIMPRGGSGGYCPCQGLFHTQPASFPRVMPWAGPSTPFCLHHVSGS